MTKNKPDVAKVDPARARQAYADANDRQSAYSAYIVLTFRSTGQLAPGCDARDLIAWYDANDCPPKSPARKTAGHTPRRRSRG